MSGVSPHSPIAVPRYPDNECSILWETQYDALQDLR